MNKELLLICKNVDVKKITVNVTMEHPYIFILRMQEKGVAIKIEDGEFIIMKKDSCGTRVASIPLHLIKNYSNDYIGTNIIDIWFDVENLNYNIVLEY